MRPPLDGPSGRAERLDGRDSGHRGHMLAHLVDRPLGRVTCPRQSTGSKVATARATLRAATGREPPDAATE